MKTLILLVLSVTFLNSCASENQQKALDEVAKTYNATTGFSKGFHNDVTYFKISVGNSDILDSLEVISTASNIALMVYDNFSEEEKKDYSHIEVEISKKNNPKNVVIRNYEVSTLAAPNKQSKIFDNFSNAVKSGDYQLMASLIDPQYRNADDADYIKKYLQKFIDENGKITEFKRTGYGLRVFENKTTNYEFTGFFIFENNKRLHYNLQTYDDVNSQYIYGFNID